MDAVDGCDAMEWKGGVNARLVSCKYVVNHEKGEELHSDVYYSFA